MEQQNGRRLRYEKRSSASVIRPNLISGHEKCNKKISSRTVMWKWRCANRALFQHLVCSFFLSYGCYFVHPFALIPLLSTNSYLSLFFLRLRSIFIFARDYFMERERRTLRSELSFKYSPGVLNSRQWNFILGQGLRQKSFRCKNYPFGTTRAKGDEIL